VKTLLDTRAGREISSRRTEPFEEWHDMKVFSILRVLALAALLTTFSRERAGAQNLALSIGGAPNPVFVSSNLTFTISFTNFTGITPLGNVFVTNTLPAGVNFLSASVNLGVFTATSNQVIFNVGALSANQGVFIVITALPTFAASLTNTVDIFSGSLGGVVSTNVIVVSSNAVAAQADLAVSISSPPNVLLNDYVTYGLTVSNLGPSAASGVAVTNTFSSGVRLISVSATNQSFTGTRLIVNLGTLNSGAGTQIQWTIEPTNSGPLTNFVFVAPVGVADTNTANNADITSFTVVDRVPGVLIATNIPPMTFNPQDSVMEQKIRLINISSSNAASARVIVAGLTTNRLYNVVGTNSLGTPKRNPFVSYNASLGPGESVDLVMEYVVTNRQSFTVGDSNLFAYAMPPFTPTTTIDTNAAFNITSVVLTPLGHVLIEFQSIPGRSYTIFYSASSSDFSAALAAEPAVTAQADRTQWIDDGPPKTISKPIDATSRFYRARLNP
jgi:uncharacterized repeat protein (TIGR01451 family)